LKFGIVGLGYVGLPLAVAAMRVGHEGVGVDLSAGVIEDLCAGRSRVDDVRDADVQFMLDHGFVASESAANLADCDVVIICVPTPLSGEGGPDLAAVRGAAESVRDNLRAGMLVVLESTTWPGTTEEFVLPILEESGLEAGTDFFLAFSPERIDPGNEKFGVVNTPKVVGGLTDACADRATEFYGSFIESVVRARGTREAEMAKLLENTYRQVNIALVNEMAKFSHELGIDIWDVIDCAATKPFGFQKFTPGPGVGGHCIPIDPSYLSHRVQTQLGYPFRFVELAQEVNRSMPRYVAGRAQELLNEMSKAVNGSTVLLLGVTYKPGIADQRESPAIPLATELSKMGGTVEFFDSFVEDWITREATLRRVSSLDNAIAAADLVIHLQPHHAYPSDMLAHSATVILDARGVLRGDNIRHL
jgi:UDP-N-acetyl-D-glucosamine dehydrogenase